MGVIKYHQIR